MVAMMNANQFYQQVCACVTQYDQDNQWFGFHRGGPVWSQGTWVQFIIAAWRLYQKARLSPMILLGDTKIRSDPHLLLNFGLVANGSSPQEEKDRKMVEDMMARRKGIAQGAHVHVGAAVQVMGAGSILSANQWSPMLNDALMLATISSRQDFHFALNDDEQAVWAREIEPLMPRGDVRPIVSAADLASRRAVFGGAVASRSREQELWLKFIKRVPRILWENGKPRIFVRELLGLMFFGYKPVFTRHELGFIHVGTATEPTFQEYLTGLRGVGLQNRDRAAIMASLGEFLFQDGKALATVGA